MNLKREPLYTPEQRERILRYVDVVDLPLIEDQVRRLRDTEWAPRWKPDGADLNAARDGVKAIERLRHSGGRAFTDALFHSGLETHWEGSTPTPDDIDTALDILREGLARLSAPGRPEASQLRRALIENLAKAYKRHTGRDAPRRPKPSWSRGTPPPFLRLLRDVFEPIVPDGKGLEELPRQVLGGKRPFVIRLPEDLNEVQ